MAGSKEEIKVCTIDSDNIMSVHTYYGGTLIEKELYAVMGNTCYPYKYFKAIQSCTKDEYEQLIGSH